MRALVQNGYGGADVLCLEERPAPVIGRGTLGVRVLACGVNGSDWEYIRGAPLYARYMGGSPNGRVLGSDICGVVEQIGAGCTGFRVGDMVLAETLGRFGGFAEHAAISADRCVVVPQGVDAVSAAALPQSGAVALSGMGDLVSAGQQVLINGAGGAAGPLAVQMALRAGADVTAVDCASKLGFLHDLGAQRVMDFAVTDYASQPERYDLILDLWGTRPVRRVRRCLAPGGTYLLVGGPMWRVLCFVFAGPVFGLGSSRSSKMLMADLGAARIPQLLHMVLDGTLDPSVSAVVPLDKAADAFARMARGDLPGKLVITP